MPYDRELDLLDHAAPVRNGEELDTEALAAYLHAHLEGRQGGVPAPLTVAQFPRGYSNLTYLLRLGDRELVLRRPPFGANIKSAHDMGREYRILRGLEGVYAKAPSPLLFCEDTSIIGAPFYVMARVPGVILRERLPAGLTILPPTMHRIGTALIATLAELHAVDCRRAGLSDLGKAEGYVERQVRGWTQRYQNAATHDLGSMTVVAQWLADYMPPLHSATLVHNDFKLDNLVLDAADLTQVRAVLDWEMATIGDPLMDLGTTLGYWTQAGDPPELQRIGLPRFEGSPRRSEVIAVYARCTGRDAAALAVDMVYYYVFGLFKIAVIAQQIYSRYRQGFTQDPRFGALDTVVAAFAGTAAAALERDRIE